MNLTITGIFTQLKKRTSIIYIKNVHPPFLEFSQRLTAAFLLLLNSLHQLLAQAAAGVLLLMHSCLQLPAGLLELVLLAGQLLTGLLQLQAVGVQVSLETLDTVYQVLLTDDENISETVPLICQSEL